MKWTHRVETISHSMKHFMACNGRRTPTTTKSHHQAAIFRQFLQWIWKHGEFKCHLCACAIIFISLIFMPIELLLHTVATITDCLTIRVRLFYQALTHEMCVYLNILGAIHSACRLMKQFVWRYVHEFIWINNRIQQFFSLPWCKRSLFLCVNGTANKIVHIVFFLGLI